MPAASLGVRFCRVKMRPNRPQAAAFSGLKKACTARFTAPAVYHAGCSAQLHRV